jgi:fibronectin-binding autotransporter adhesin
MSHSRRSESSSRAAVVRSTAKTSSRLVRALLSAIAGLLGVTSAHAATGTWAGDADGNWSDTTKWTTNTLADGATFTANLTFNITAARTITLDSARTIGTVNIGDLTTSSHSFTLSLSNDLTFNNSTSAGVLAQNSSSFGDTISGSGKLVIAGNGTLNVTNAASGKILTVSAGIVSGLASGVQTLNFNNANAVTVDGVVGDGALGGKIAVTKNGFGTTILSATNTYTGGSTINAGVLQFGSALAIAGAGQNVVVNSGGTAAFGYAFDQSTLTGRIVAGSNGTVALAADNSNDLDFAASGLTNLSLGASGGAYTYSGSLWTPSGNIYRLGGGGGTLVFNPTLTGASNSLLVGGNNSGGTVTLVNAGTYGGGTTVSGGVGSGNAAIGSANGAGLLQTNVLSGVSTTPFGTSASITLNNGALGLGTGGTLAGGESVNATGYDITYNGQNAIKLQAGGGNVTLAANTLTRVNNGVMLLNPTSGGALGNTEKVTVASGAPTVINGMVAPYYINQTTRNFLTYGPNGFQDVTYSVVGTTDTDIANANANSTVVISNSTFNTSIGGNKAIYALKLVNTNSQFNANAIGLSGETLTLLSGGLILDTTAGGGINFSSDATRAAINFGAAEAVVGIFGANVALGSSPWIGTGGLTIYGTGSYQASNVSITGGVTIAGATLRLGGSNGINTNNQLTIDKAGTFQFIAGNTQQVLGLSGEGLMNTSSGSPTFIVDGLTGTGTTIFKGNIQNGSGTVAFTKTGANTQVFTGANTYGGTTTVNNGILRLDFSATGAPVNNIINNQTNTSALVLGGGRLDIVGAASATNSQQFSTLTVGAGNSSISATSGTSGTTNVTLGSTLTRNVGGTINFNLPASGSISTAATTFAGNGVLVGTSATGAAFATVNGTDWAKVTGGTIGALASYEANDFSASTKNTDVTSNQGPVAFTVNTLRFNTAATTLTLTGSNVVGTGGILVTAATAGAGNGVTITGGTNIKSSAGNELVIINNGQLTVDSVLANGAAASALTLSGSGTTTLNAANTYTGSTYLNSGTVVVGNAAAFGTTAGTLNLNGGTLQSNAALTLNAKPVSLINDSSIGGSNDLTLSGNFTNSGRNNILTVNNTGATTLSGSSIFLSNSGSGSSLTLNIGGTGNLTISGTIKNSSSSGNGNLVYAGSGNSTLTLANGANIYSGTTKVSGGTLSVDTLTNEAALTTVSGSISTNTITVASNAGLFVGQAVTGTGIAAGATITGISGTTITLSATNSAAVSGTGVFGGATITTASGSVNGSTITVGSAAGLAIGQSVIGTGIGSGATITGISGTTITLSATNSSSTAPTGNATFATGATNSSLGTSTSAATNLILDGGTLKYTGAATTTNRLFSVGGAGGAIDASGSGALNFIGAGSIGFNNTPGARTLTLTGTNTGANTLNPIISDHLGLYATSLTKSGAGQWVLSGVNTYTGATLINTGTLALGASGAINANSAITVAEGATFDTTAQSYTFSTAKTTTIGVGATGAGLINSAAVTFSSANLGFDFGATSTLLASYTVLVKSGFTGDFNSVVATGTSVSGSFLNAGSGNWTLTAGGYDLTFSQSLGTLTAVVSAVPEPATYAAIFGVLALAGAAWQRRRAVRR